MPSVGNVSLVEGIVLIYFLGYLIGTSVHVTNSGILNCTNK
jgi:hypothetical protein